jgi:hypothetical protein
MAGAAGEYEALHCRVRDYDGYTRRLLLHEPPAGVTRAASPPPPAGRL